MPRHHPIEGKRVAKKATKPERALRRRKPVGKSFELSVAVIQGALLIAGKKAPVESRSLRHLDFVSTGNSSPDPASEKTRQKRP